MRTALFCLAACWSALASAQTAKGPLMRSAVANAQPPANAQGTPVRPEAPNFSLKKAHEVILLRSDPATLKKVEDLNKGKADADKLSVRVLTGNADKTKNSVVLVDFWAPWCKPCLAAMPEVEKLHQELGSKGLLVVGLAVKSDLDDVKAAKASVTYLVAMDGETPADSSLTQYNEGKEEFSIPFMVVVDKTGKIAAQHVGVGPSTEADIRREIEAELKK